MITFEQLEAIVINEAQKPTSPSRSAPDIFEVSFPLLYIAAKCGEISVLDALIACRAEAEITRLIARDILTAADVDDVEKVIEVKERDIPEFPNRWREDFILVDWLKKHGR